MLVHAIPYLSLSPSQFNALFQARLQATGVDWRGNRATSSLCADGYDNKDWTQKNLGDDQTRNDQIVKFVFVCLFSQVRDRIDGSSL